MTYANSIHLRRELLCLAEQYNFCKAKISLKKSELRTYSPTRGSNAKRDMAKI